MQPMGNERFSRPSVTTGCLNFLGGTQAGSDIMFVHFRPENICRPYSSEYLVGGTMWRTVVITQPNICLFFSHPRSFNEKSHQVLH